MLYNSFGMFEIKMISIESGENETIIVIYERVKQSREHSRVHAPNFLQTLGFISQVLFEVDFFFL